MKFENTKVMNFQNALRGMRNPKNSWDKSDTVYGFYSPMSIDEYNKKIPKDAVILQQKGGITEYIKIGDDDLRLAQRLIKAGAEHRKFMRQIFVSVDITAPMYFMSEIDTYKVGTSRNSSSFQHKGVSKPFELCDFEIDARSKFWELIINELNHLREVYLETKDYNYFRKIRQMLPSSYLYRSTFGLNYEVILNMIRQRENHPLREWSGGNDPETISFISWARILPYAKELLFLDKEERNE